MMSTAFLRGFCDGLRLSAPLLCVGAVALFVMTGNALFLAYYALVLGAMIVFGQDFWRERQWRPAPATTEGGL